VPEMPPVYVCAPGPAGAARALSSRSTAACEAQDNITRSSTPQKHAVWASGASCELRSYE
jgi:hypothetical protein